MFIIYVYMSEQFLRILGALLLCSKNIWSTPQVVVILKTCRQTGPLIVVDFFIAG